MSQLPPIVSTRLLPSWIYECNWTRFSDSFFPAQFSQSFAWGNAINDVYRFAYDSNPDYIDRVRIRKAYDEVIKFVLWTQRFIQDCIDLYPTSGRSLQLYRFINLKGYMYRSCTECFKCRHVLTVPFDHTSLEIYDDLSVDFGIIRFSEKKEFTVKYTLSDIENYEFVSVTAHVCSSECEKVFCPDIRELCCLHVTKLYTKAIELIISKKYTKAVVACADISNIQEAVDSFTEQIREFEAAKHEYETATKQVHTQKLLQSLEKQRAVQQTDLSSAITDGGESLLSTENNSNNE